MALKRSTCKYCDAKAQPFRDTCFECEQRRLSESVLVNCQPCKGYGKFASGDGWGQCWFCRGTRQVLIHKDQLRDHILTGWRLRNEQLYFSHDSVTPMMSYDWRNIYQEIDLETLKNSRELRKKVVRPIPEPKKETYPKTTHQWVEETEEVLFSF